jgi:hypothetical protein
MRVDHLGLTYCTVNNQEPLGNPQGLPLKETQMPKLEWNKDVRVLYTGRNGNGFSCGVSIIDFDGKICIAPINSKGLTARCDIDIPKDKIQELIDVLESVK